MRKRGRCLLDVSSSLDSLMAFGDGCKVPMSSSLSNNGDNGDSQSSNSNSITKDNNSAICSRFAANTSCDQIDSQKSTGSAFATEISFFCKEEEETADMCIYLARAVSSARTQEALIALVKHFITHDPSIVMMSLKRSGLQSKLLDILCKTSNEGIKIEQQCLFLRFFVFIVKLCDIEILCEVSLIKFLLLHCKPPQESSNDVVSVKTHQSSHWSQRVKRTPTVAVSQRQDITELTLLINTLLGEKEDKTSLASLALRALLDITFRQNSNLALFADSNICLIFAELGGFDIVSALLSGNECEDALHLLEVVTLCEGLRTTHTLALRQTALHLVRLITADDDEHHGEINAALRVLTNVTGLVPSVLSGEDKECHALATKAAKTLLDDEAMPDTLAFTLCFTTNIVKWEAREGHTNFTSSLVESPFFLTRIASLTFRAYHTEDTEKNVLAGYYALLLAVLSLCAAPTLELRVPVMTAVAEATKGTVAGKKVESKPMTLIVALLQEFIFFQSSAGSLTKDSLLSMNNIIESVVKHNNIEITSDD
ncbi:uncharacterized protein TM35_000017120 [Trypanosoma theileri]|uniref:Wings apart-like protein C-terminal domain-containing protein n=1 Tax=Trypanosoma theileri TaxID=67003 RepID=A0A1X0PAI7_9TRYP|nr:uncharacterized protein TM35_000017120 [Trypanosoma theileri]ORC93835.1 hypothetical protein TM35_000017120 [Trypanosoma theileri]